MASKMTLFYNLASGGFSETFYYPTDDPFLLASNIPQSFYQAAVKFRHTTCFLVAARFSSVDIAVRKSFLVKPYPKAQGGAGSATEVGPDVLSTDAVIRLQSTDSKTRRIFLRGLADEDVRRDVFGNDIPSAALYSGIDKYFKAIANAGLAIRWIQRPPDGGLVWRKVVQVNHLFTVAPDRCHFFEIPDVAPLTVGQRVSFRGIPSTLPGFPRSALILGVTTVDGINNYMIAYRLPGGVQIGPGNMLLTNYQPQYSAIAAQTFERFSEHKSGRPFGSLRGRARGLARIR